MDSPSVTHQHFRSYTNPPTFDPEEHRKPSTVLKKFFKGEVDLPANDLNAVDKAELVFLQRFKDELSKTDIPFLESIPANAYLAERVSILKDKFVVPLLNPNMLVNVIGPTLESGVINEEPKIFPNACVQSISTYPKRNERVRDGQPICDRYGLCMFENRSIAVIADGCNWGERPKLAAIRARDAVMKYLLEKHEKIHTVADAQLYLLRSFAEAQRRVCEHKEEEDIGSTTLLAGMMLQIEGNSDEWAFVSASVGDCKAFLIEMDTLKVRDLTEDSRPSGVFDSCDCGGRLGPVLPDGGPDLRNLRTYCSSCQPGDLIIMVSDGVHDNLHPISLNVQPRELKLDFDNWEDAQKVVDIEKVATLYRTKKLAHLIAGDESQFTPEHVHKKIMQHVEKITLASRDWMETNPGKRIPLDYKAYPGKMDHTTCMVFRVGKASTPYSRSMSLIDDISLKMIPPTPISVTVTKSAEFLTIYCRTIAKGKFECLAKRKECILTVTPKKSFQLPSSEKIHGQDELAGSISRVIRIPDEISIDIHSKHIDYNSELGVIVIQFAIK